MMKYFSPLIFILIIAMVSPDLAQARNGHKIRVLVDDSPITDFHIRQRINLHLMSSRDMNNRLRTKLKSKSTQKRWRAYIEKQRPTSKKEVVQLQKKFVARMQNEVRSGFASGLKKKVLDELINERLMVSSAKRQNIVISNDVLEQRIEMIAKRNSKNATPEQAKKAFYSQLRRQGVGKRTFREKIRSTLAWQQLVRRKFGREVNFGDRDVEQQLGLDPTAQRDKKVQFNLQRIVISSANKKDQNAAVQQFVQADAIRKRFNGCANMKSLIAPLKNAKVIKVGNTTLDKVPSPMNLILSDMKVGQITPPRATQEGLEMYAVCGRKQVTIDDKERRKVIAKLRQNAFQLRSQRYLKDLRDEAHIEYRD